MRFGHATPILRSFDEAKAKEFYVSFLGFEVDWEHRFAPDLPLYMQVRRDGLILHISEHHGDATPGSAVRVEVCDVDAYCRELNEKKYRNSRPGTMDQQWGTRDMTIPDQFGNKLTFFTNLAVNVS